MHELAVTESLLEITLRHAAEAQARRVTDINLVIGELSTIVDESVQFYWDIISDQTIASGAVLHFKRIPIEISCLDCNHRYAPGDQDFSCPNCHSERIKVVAGEEFFLDSIEVE